MFEKIFGKKRPPRFTPQPADDPPTHDSVILVELEGAGWFTGFWSMGAGRFRLADVTSVWREIPPAHPAVRWMEFQERKDETKRQA